MYPTLLLRRADLERALTQLPSTDLAVLVALVLRADPVTPRVGVTLEDLGIQVAAPLRLVSRSIERLARMDFLEVLSIHGEQLLIELGPVLVRRGAPPPNLPIEQPPYDS